MLNYIWAFIMLTSIVCAAITGRVEILSGSILSGAEEAVSLVISMMGMMAIWSGLMKIAESGGITQILSLTVSPLLKFLFPDYSLDSKALHAICMNMTANFLGLGNAATPFGIMAMKEMNKNRKNKSTVNNSMAMFIVINTASLQLIPTFLSMLRQKHHSTSPLSIIPALWITSVVSLCAGIITAKLLEKVWGNGD